MDFFPDADALSLWLTHYGSWTLFALLALGIIALPIPEETLMVLTGILIHQEKLQAIPAMLAALGGSLCGMTISYLIGRTAGHFLLFKYGPRIGLTKQRLQKAQLWFERFGRWALLIGYFIPGVRHLTGVCAGSSYLSFRQFSLYAYSGAIIWVSSFLSIGYFFGKHWMILYSLLAEKIDRLAVPLIAFIAVIIIAHYYRKYKRRKKSSKK